MNKSKWVKASADDDVVDVARQVLEARLDRVWHYLPAAANGPASKLENVHQLRVATRRAVAAMGIFSDLLPPRHARWMNKQLKRVRKAAGPARDLDVLAQRVEQLAQQHAPQQVGPLTDEVKLRRAAAQKPITKIQAKLARRDVADRQRRLIKHTRLRTAALQEAKPTYAEAARAALASLAEHFLSASAADFTDYSELHAFRIEGKQLRYVMEVFADAFGDEFRKDLYKQVEQLQQRLGEINDHASAGEFFSTWLTACNDPPLAEAWRSMIAAEEAATEAGRREFVEWWTPERREQLRQTFDTLLGNEPGKSPAGRLVEG